MTLSRVLRSWPGCARSRPSRLLAVTSATADDPRYSAEIRRTEYGIPHIVANDYGSLGYGYGYAFAQDNLCVMADRVVTLRGDRSQVLRPEGERRRSVRRRRGRDEQRRERRLLPGRTAVGRRAAAARPAGAAGADGSAAADGRRLCRRLQPLPARHRGGEAAGSDLSRQGLGRPDHRARRMERHLRPQLPARDGPVQGGDRQRAPGGGCARPPTGADHPGRPARSHRQQRLGARP